MRRVRHGRDGITLEADGASVRAKRAILAVAPSLAGRLAYDPPLPGFRDQLAQRMPLGTVAKCMAIYDEPFWRADGLSGQGASDSGPVKLTFDTSPPDGSPGVLLGFLEGRGPGTSGACRQRNGARPWSIASSGCSGRAPPDPTATSSACGPRRNGREAATAAMPTGAWTSYGRALREPIGPLHWAGAEYATVWNGYMDGAVRSGRHAAAEALGLI